MKYYLGHELHFNKNSNAEIFYLCYKCKKYIVYLIIDKIYSYNVSPYDWKPLISCDEMIIKDILE